MTSSFWGHWAKSWLRTTKTFLSDYETKNGGKTRSGKKLWDNDCQFLSEKENLQTGKITWHQSLFCRDSKLVDCTLWLVPSHSKWRRWVRASADRMKKSLYLKPTCEDDLWAPLLSAWHQRDVVAKRGISWDFWPTSIRDPHQCQKIGSSDIWKELKSSKWQLRKPPVAVKLDCQQLASNWRRGSRPSEKNGEYFWQLAAGRPKAGGWSTEGKISGFSGTF